MPQPQVGKQRQQATEKAKTSLIATPSNTEPETCTKPISGYLKRETEL